MKKSEKIFLTILISLGLLASIVWFLCARLVEYAWGSSAPLLCYAVGFFCLALIFIAVIGGNP